VDFVQEPSPEIPDFKTRTEMAHCRMAGLSVKAKGLVYSNLEKYARSGMGMEKACDSLLRQPHVRSAEKSSTKAFLAG
jgi:hypothetical protein